MLIKANNLTKRYGTKLALDNINLQIDRGQLIAYLGTNGAGKSTTINLRDDRTPSRNKNWRCLPR